MQKDPERGFLHSRPGLIVDCSYILFNGISFVDFSSFCLSGNLMLCIIHFRLALWCMEISRLKYFHEKTHLKAVFKCVLT